MRLSTSPRRSALALLLGALALGAASTTSLGAQPASAVGADGADGAVPVTASHRAAVQRLLEVTRARELSARTSDAIIDSQLQQMPQLAPYASVLRDFYHEQTSWSVVEPELTQLYSEVFTEPEIRELTAFYQTSLGQKMLTKLPMVMTRSNQLTSARLQAAMPKLMARLQAAMQGSAPGAMPGTAPGADSGRAAPPPPR